MADAANGKGPAADELLTKLAAGNTDYGTITYGKIANLKESANAQQMLNGPDAEVLVCAVITLNDDIGSNWFLGDDDDRAAAILHELAHAYDIMFGSGSSGLADESSGKTPEEQTKISMTNQALIKEKCFK